MAIRVLLADDHELVRQGLRTLLEEQGFQIAGEAQDGREAVRLAIEVQADIAIVDFSMPRLNGVGVARELRARSHAIRIVLLTRHDEPQYVAEALEAGVDAYVLKRRAATDLVQALRRVVDGGTWLGPLLGWVALAIPLM
jgi:DNA-binding NarL/FixJ family response regulator